MDALCCCGRSRICREEARWQELGPGVGDAYAQAPRLGELLKIV